MRWFRTPEGKAKRVPIIIVALLSLVLLVFVDWITGPSVTFTCFYLFPVFYLTWYGGWKLGILVAVLHALVWFFIDLEWIGHLALIMGWNVIVRFGTFAAVAWFIHMSRQLSGEIDRLSSEQSQSLKREVESRAASERSIRQLANQLSVAEDVERRRLGQELHDSLGQSLTLLKLKIESQSAGLTPEQARSASETLAFLSTIIQQARTLTFELYPTMLDQLGLSAALAQYAAELSSHVSAQIRVSESGPQVLLPTPVVSFLFRAVKELINNALKHGAAKEVVVQIRRRGSSVRLVVSDDGTGFAADPDRKPGLGLAWIRERLTSLGGQLAIESSPGEGTRASIDLPLVAPPETKTESHADGPIAAG